MPTTYQTLEAENEVLRRAIQQIIWKLERKEMVNGKAQWATINRNDATIRLARPLVEDSI